MSIPQSGGNTTLTDALTLSATRYGAVTDPLGFHRFKGRIAFGVCPKGPFDGVHSALKLL